MLSQSRVGVVVVAPDGRFFERAVHAFDLAVRPRVVGPGQAMFDIVFAADAIEHVGAVLRGWSIAVLRHVTELDAVAGEHGVDLVRYRHDQAFEESCRSFAIGLIVELDEGEFARAIDGNEHVELAFPCSQFGNADMEVADRILLEALLGLIAVDCGQPRDGVALEQPVQGRTGWLRNRRLQGVEAVQSSGNSVCLRKATHSASSAGDSTVERGSAGSIGRSSTVSRDRHFITVFGFRP